MPYPHIFTEKASKEAQRRDQKINRVIKFEQDLDWHALLTEAAYFRRNNYKKYLGLCSYHGFKGGFEEAYLDRTGKIIHGLGRPWELPKDAHKFENLYLGTPPEI